MDASQKSPVPATPRKLSEAEREKMLFQLVDASRTDMARSIAEGAERLAMRAAILKLAESSGLDRKQFSEWIDKLTKHFHHQLLTSVEDKDAWLASVLDDRKGDEI
jgi:hypothetical protein